VPIDPREIFQRFKADRAGRLYPGVTCERLPRLYRYTAVSATEHGQVSFAELPTDEVDQSIDEQVEYFRALGQVFEWKVYDFDAPPTLRRSLAEKGFRQDDREAFMVLEPRKWQFPARELAGMTIRKISDLEDLHDFVAAEKEIWPSVPAGNLERYTRELEAEPNALSIYCAYAGGRAVGTGRVRFPAGSVFADLNGGGVVSELRGRGIFTALLAHRIEEAKARGYPWVAVDAAPMSRPILLKKGFEHVCWTYPMMREP
jgi:GNAT superfamily N-acetyltransferase